MAISRILKNTTNSDILIESAGLSVPANGQITVSFSDIYKVIGDSIFESAVNSGNLIINNGTTDLSASDGLLFWKAQSNEIRFTNTSNNFPSNNVQATIEDVYNLQRICIVTTFNGTVGNNQWLGYDNLLPGNTTPIVVPVKCILREITFSYTNTGLLGIPTGSSLIDGTFRLYKNNLSSESTTTVLTNQAGPHTVTGLSVELLPGDWFVGRWQDQGDNPSDCAITYWLQPVF